MIVDELITLLGFDIKDKDKLDKYQHAIGSVVSELKTMATVGATAMSAMLVGITAVNSETAKLANLSETVGLNYDLVAGLGGAIKAIGLDYEHVIDLAEEVSNKVGESKSIYDDWLKNDKGKGKELKLVGGMEDAFKGLDFSIVDKKFKDLNMEEKFKKFSSLDSTKQFELVMDTASMMKDTQKAVSMVDILMGGEANKILGYLRTQGTTLTELLRKRKEMNFLDKEGLEGAKAYAKTFADTSSIFGSIGKELAGISGKYLTPILKKMNLWFRANKKIVQVKMKAFIEGVFHALNRVWDILKMTWSVIDNIASAFGGWGVVLPILGAILAYFYPWKALIVGVMLVFDDLMTYFEGGKSVTGDFIAYFSANFPLLSAIISKVGDVFVSIFGLFKSVYDAVVAPVFQLFKSDGESSSSSVLSVFTDAFNAIGVVVKSVLEMLSLSIQSLSALFRGDFENMRAIGEQFTEALTIAFGGMVNFISAGAGVIKKAWGASIDWIMSKIKWVTDKIDAIKSTASGIGDDISDSISSAWDGAINFFGGDDKKSDKIERVKETINNIAPISAPAPSSKSVSNHKTNNISHTHNNNYTIKVNSTGSDAHKTAETIKSHIVSTKAIEKANINKIKPIHEAT